MAEASVQPVPCVARVSMRASSNSCSPSASPEAPGPGAAPEDVDDHRARRWPPFSSTARGPMASSCATALRIASTLSMTTPVSASASGMFT